jgi:hypothetical protein
VEQIQSKPRITHRIAHELKQYVAVSLYLYVCFGAILLYRAAVLHAQGIDYLPYGVAAIKALILGKFMLVGHALRMGEHRTGTPLIYPILHKSLLFLALLVVLDLLEEVIAGAMHERSVVESLADFGGGTWLQIGATCLLMFLILVPYFAYREVANSLGEDTLKRMLLRGGAGQRELR